MAAISVRKSRRSDREGEFSARIAAVPRVELLQSRGDVLDDKKCDVAGWKERVGAKMVRPRKSPRRRERK